jgi:hypothetical protein
LQEIVQEIVEEKAQMIAGAAAIVMLLMLAGMHLYWAAGGKAGKGAAVPSASGRPLMRPSVAQCARPARQRCRH